MTEDLKYKIGFSMISGNNLSFAEKLLARCGSEEQYFKLTSSELSALGLTVESIRSDAKRKALLDLAEKEIDFILRNQIEPLYFRGPCFPSRLRNCEDAPVMLYQLGQTDLERPHFISVVGTRNATPYGIDMTTRIIRDLSERLDNLVIVSGLAYGIDVAAHKAALQYGLPTIAIVAHPLNTLYPADHRDVAVRILRQGGAIITEYPSSAPVHKANFLARNRIIAGISDVTIVVESDAKGGSLATARYALEYNRDVYAVPGRITDKYSRGTLELISNNSAALFTSVDDLIAGIGWQSKNMPGEQLSLPIVMTENEKALHDFLMANPASTITEIMSAVPLSPSLIKDTLFTMEMKDLVMVVAGGKYAAIAAE